MNISRDHHYLPQFYIKGFTDDDGKLWIYDKKADRIITKKKPPSAYFFEKDINTITIDNKQVDLIEQAYGKLDNYYANKIIKIRDENVDSIENLENASIIDIFMMFQYWRRHPNNEEVNNVAKKMLEFYRKEYNSNVIKFGKNISESDIEKIEKSILPFLIMKESKVIFNFGDIGYFKIINFEEPFYFISDYPMIFRKIPLSNNDLFNQSKIFPISRNRVYVALDGKDYTLNLKQSMLINILLIEQADKYVGSFSRKNLNFFVNMYRDMKSKNVKFQEIKDELFKHVNSIT